ncbi:MAG TPA: PQQ-binding-like beta-propeller repeat protein [Candidatus Thermoplasmatota archaeon]|nr:PQQ-binding-like beta-propeller repeat protein [Candidatus Thermoplasmatota archaeon]
MRSAAPLAIVLGLLAWSVPAAPSLACDERSLLPGAGCHAWERTEPGGRAVGVAASPDGASFYTLAWLYVADGVRGSLDYVTVAYDAATGAERWRARFDGGGTEWPHAILASRDGLRVYVTGQSGNPQGRYDAATVAYDARTGETLWTLRHGDVESAGRGIAESPDGATVYVTGSTRLGPSAILVAAHDAQRGDPRWTARYSGFGSGTSVAVSQDGSTVVATGWRMPDGGNPFEQTDGIALAINASDGRIRWVDNLTSPPAARHNILLRAAVDDVSGLALATGAVKSAGTGYDAFTVAYDLQTGVRVWSDALDLAGGHEDALALALSNGTLVVAGNTGGAGRDGFSSCASPADFLTVAYEAATGARRWVATYDGPGGKEDCAFDVVASGDGKVYVAGLGIGLGTCARTFTYPCPVAGYGALALAYDLATGAASWMRRYEAPGYGVSDAAYALALSPDGARLVLAGITSSALVGDGSLYASPVFVRQPSVCAVVWASFCWEEPRECPSAAAPACGGDDPCRGVLRQACAPVTGPSWHAWTAAYATESSTPQPS